MTTENKSKRGTDTNKNRQQKKNNAFFKSKKCRMHAEKTL